MELIAPNLESSFYNYMIRLHGHHEDLCCKLLDAMATRSPNARRFWSELDESLRTHMESEERYVLPAFARIDREEALALIRDHGRIREQLLEIGVAIDLHELAQTQRFIDTIREHAAREDKLMARWATAPTP
ncbi:MAG: hemerythrin domain-containing protein [Deltaproteobacteria bacterium]|nr:hemerythrin domain-containing protein [Deltaproteobacteria bacterium]